MKLAAPVGAKTRPTSDRVREALFNIVRHKLEGARFLDLFAGSGAVGLEALSRGAPFAVFVDKRPECARVIRRNVEKARFVDKARILTMDAAKAVRFLAAEGQIFDLVYLDPPYLGGFGGEGLIPLVLSEIDRGGVAGPGALVVAESALGDAAAVPGELGYLVTRSERYGDTALTFMEKTETVNDSDLSGQF